MSNKIEVPHGMQLAFVEAMQKRFGSVPGGTAVGLSAALEWLDEELQGMYLPGTCDQLTPDQTAYHSAVNGTISHIQRMFWKKHSWRDTGNGDKQCTLCGAIDCSSAGEYWCGGVRK